MTLTRRLIQIFSLLWKAVLILVILAAVVYVLRIIRLRRNPQYTPKYQPFKSIYTIYNVRGFKEWVKVEHPVEKNYWTLRNFDRPNMVLLALCAPTVSETPLIEEPVKKRPAPAYINPDWALTANVPPKSDPKAPTGKMLYVNTKCEIPYGFTSEMLAETSDFYNAVWTWRVLAQIRAQRRETWFYGYGACGWLYATYQVAKYGHYYPDFLSFLF